MFSFRKMFFYTSCSIKIVSERMNIIMKGYKDIFRTVAEMFLTCALREFSSNKNVNDNDRLQVLLKLGYNC